jgi:hypothetical protein
LAKRPEDFVPPFPEIWKLVNEKLKELWL